VRRTLLGEIEAGKYEKTLGEVGQAPKKLAGMAKEKTTTPQIMVIRGEG